jgi:hypothetical protein
MLNTSFKKLIVFALSLFITQLIVAQNDTLPELNQKMVEFVAKNIGKKVDRGECWDLAAIPLKENNAKWDGFMNFGRKIDYKKEGILPGDIIQFENVQIKIEEGNKIMMESYQKHTAVVFEVLSKNHIKIGQQNTSHHGKKVSIDDLLIDHIVKGKITIYRPEK